MRVGLAIGLFVLFLLSACGKRDVEGFKISNLVDESLLKAHMDRVSAFTQWLEIAIDERQWDKISLYSSHVDSLCDVLNLEKMVLSPEKMEEVPLEFILIDDKFHESIDSMVEASKRRDAEGVREEFERMKEVCEECHARFRQKR